MIINYGVTMDGLANQLLNVVVAHERPDLEKQWADLVIEMSENTQLLVDYYYCYYLFIHSFNVVLIMFNTHTHTHTHTYTHNR